MASSSPSPVLVGRSGELSALRAALQRARDGSASVVLLSGEAGIGKTTLLDQAAREAREQDVMVLVGEEAPYAYGPLMGVLRELRRQVGDQRLQRMLTGVRRPLVRLVPGLEPGQTSDHGELAGAQAPLFEAVLDLVAYLGRDGPLLVAMEDVHRADESTLDLLGFLSANLKSEPAALVVTYRTGESQGGRVRTLLAELARQPRVERIDLSRLCEEEVIELLAAVGGGPPAEDVAVRIARRSQGNPFFVEELFASGGDQDLPSELEELLVARVEELPEEARQVLSAAAVLGSRPHDQLLRTIAGLSAPELRAGLRAAADHGVLVPESGPSDRYRFRHDLVREAVHRRLLVDQRRQLHGLAADELEAHPELAVGGTGHVHAELAGHWHLAGEPDRAFTASIAASEEAGRVHAASEALAHLRRAGRLWDDVSPETRTAAGPRYELELRLVETALRVNDPVVALRHTEKALGQPDVPIATQAQLHISAASFLRQTGRAHGSWPRVERALELLPVEPSPERADVLALTAIHHLLSGQPENAHRYSSEAIEVARMVEDRGCEAMALNYHGLVLQDLGREDEGIDAVRRSLALALEAGARPAGSRGTRIRDPGGILRGYDNLCEVLRRAGRFSEAVQTGIEGRAWAAEHDTAASEEVLLLNTIDALVSAERWSEADELLSSVRPVSRANVLTGAFETLLRARVRLAQGRLDETGDLLDRLPDSVFNDDAQHHGPYLATVVSLGLARGRHDQVRQAVARAQHAGQRIVDGQGRVTFEAAVYWDPTLAHGISSEIDRAASTDRNPAVMDEVTDRVDGLLGTLRRGVSQAPHGTHVHARLVASLAVAEAEPTRLAPTAEPRAWRHAVDAAGRAGLPHRQAYARFRLAEALLSTGERGTAAAELEEADRITEELGAVLLRQQIASLARRGQLGLDIAHQDQNLGSDLTPREIDVLELLVQGQTNRQIGENLYITEKTVENHVTNILTKLQVDNRTAAASIARQRDLFDTR